ncbi:MAG TPA: (2Fe-2S) ferredoxin domain-containing protein [Candidatus Tenderia sp.]|nr:(2Fe-2S) ferredoxin domain-containing protein [Candidatus Tenderia sp.]
MSFYQRHAFICANQASDGSPSCQDHNAMAMVKYAKNRLKELGLFGPGKVRLNKSGCMGRCAIGPVMVVYPEGTWYTYVDKDDIEEIIQEHLLNGREVERLKV